MDPNADDERGKRFLTDTPVTFAERREAKIAELQTRIAVLEEALSEAILEIDHWAGYADKYFRQKWDLDGVLDRFRKILEVEAT